MDVRINQVDIKIKLHWRKRFRQLRLHCFIIDAFFGVRSHWQHFNRTVNLLHIYTFIVSLVLESWIMHYVYEMKSWWLSFEENLFFSARHIQIGYCDVIQCVGGCESRIILHFINKTMFLVKKILCIVFNTRYELLEPYRTISTEDYCALQKNFFHWDLVRPSAKKMNIVETEVIPLKLVQFSSWIFYQKTAVFSGNIIDANENKYFPKIFSISTP